ncbi:MAG TPA: FKBP-type peptidyl-prolyl cis-trans isomerase [Opitutaceae bacterium]|nr:FKBP-type peptidyl-prolyl cis-trans isomerase [Opitutaceae bacterium]
MRSYIYILLLGAALLTLAVVVRSGMFARKNPGEPLNSAMRAALAETTPELSSDDAAIVRRQYPTAYTSPSGLMSINRAPGAGTATPRVGDSVVANYVGRLLDGTPFDSSFAHGGPFTFQLGMGKVIKGWDEAFLTMRKGAKRTLIIPYWLAYDGSNRPPSVPYHATLVFDVELVDFR